MHADDDGLSQTLATGQTVMRYHLRWKHRDLDGVMALYHPDISFYRYVNQARLQHLLAALDNATPPLRIDELAFAAGFNSLSAFYSCFRRHTGLSPKAYAKQISLRARAQDNP